MRALEVYHTTGVPIWKHHENQSSKKQKKYIYNQFGLNWERSILYNNIDTRVDEMIDNRLVDEVKNLLNSGYTFFVLGGEGALPFINIDSEALKNPQ